MSSTRLEHELRQDPGRHIRYIRDDNRHQYSFSIVDELEPGKSHLFVFYLDYHPENQDIIVSDCSYSLWG